MVKQIDAKQLQAAFLAGAARLQQNKELINELNVFPVPDGDTGTNMTMTIMSAARDVAEITEPTIENVAKAMASGSLRGARETPALSCHSLFADSQRRSERRAALTVWYWPEPFPELWRQPTRPL